MGRLVMEKIIEQNPDALFADGLEGALIGYVHRAGSSPVACYDEKKAIEAIQLNGDLTREEALDYYYFNVAGAYVGENTPFFLVKTG